MKNKIKYAVIIFIIGGMIMSYTRVNWQNAPSTATPVNAENLNTMDKGIADAHSQLAETSQQLNSNSKVKKAYLSIVSDDGSIEDFTILKPLFDSKGIKACFATRTDGQDSGSSVHMSWEQLKQLQDEGHEIASHTRSHKNLTTVDYAETFYQLNQSKQDLISHGIDVSAIVYPNGVWTDNTLEIARDLYDYGMATWQSYNGEDMIYNHTPIDQYAIQRKSYSKPFNSELAKSDLDETILNNGWLVLCIHGFEFQDTENGIQGLANLENFLDYAISTGIEIVLPKDAMKIFGNNIDIGDYTKGYFKVGKDGSIDSSTLKKFSMVNKPNDNIDGNTPLTSFEKNKITVTSFTTANDNYLPGTPAGKPSGVLTTYNVDNNLGVGFQTWQPVSDETALYRRTWNSGGSAWRGWVKYSADGNSFNILDKIGITVDSLPSVFPSAYSICSLISSDASGFPINISGTLITNKLGNTVNWYQEWHPVGSDGLVCKRHYSAGAWGDWKYLYNVNKITKTVITPSVSANSSEDIDVTITGLKTWHNVVVTPNSAMPSGIILNWFIKSTDVLTLRFYNFGGAAATPVQGYVISVIS